MAGLHKKFHNKHDETIENFVKHFKVLEGEILAGNDNPQILRELKEVLYKLHHLGKISIKQVNKYLNQFQLK